MEVDMNIEELVYLHARSLEARSAILARDMKTQLATNQAAFNRLMRQGPAIARVRLEMEASAESAKPPAMASVFD